MHEKGALTLEESDCAKRSRRDVDPMRLSFLSCFSNWVAPRHMPSFTLVEPT